MDGPTQPLAFISHSSADNERIARPLDVMLRERGIRVWLDERDLLPGRNLVDEIFDRGISKSDAFIAILTSNSIESAWVHEELTNAFVQKLNGIVKVIIPVILDGVKVPDFLGNTVWEVINDDKSAVHADRIAATIIGTQPAPVAPLPAYAGIPVHSLPGITQNDERIFAATCNQVLENPFYDPIVDFGSLFDYGASVGLSKEQVSESIAVLERQGYFRDVTYSYGGGSYPRYGFISFYGYEQYLMSYMPTQYRAAKIEIVSEIVNTGAFRSRVGYNGNAPDALVEHVLQSLEYGGHVIASRSNTGTSVQATPTIRRLLQELQSDAAAT